MNQKAKFSLQRIYLKDLSIEMPNAPKIFIDLDKYKIDVNVQVNTIKLSDNIFESSITAIVKSTVHEKIIYIIEATQAGIFEFENISQKNIDELLSTNCYTIIYPYLRANVSDFISRTSLPPINLEELDFNYLYQNSTN
ncbi:protein-export chaperone SecB [Candidatus Kinetoplastidibacterium crithidiae]|uniref:Preprotein translocase subunit SecB n=1 Tax=Candidatus Kinetoplastidibacterium crithidiae TCC036E TaxID=1208918 RepID=M1LQP1_9PROT|nr:protein-export chaperone SecB [Candidatus Kinetoplastibacterium crithidii]AFZ82915.1 preprotein translocase subunit SecB [Candidatus Kinetoplastibacterium crithidii (ex Angomonas deanei ATCC 30255)]AGF47917.1 preprotein translocase subunit SecB [Candidatus Kinetoplastibacterium crithidii TCC036E]